MVRELASVRFYLPETEEDKALPWMDHTTVSAIHTCHRWGMLRYVASKAVSSITSTRALPLECGSALHQCFAGHRIHHIQHEQRDDVSAGITLRRVFGTDRAEFLSKFLTMDDPYEIMREVLYSSGYYDDPDDSARTLSNMDHAIRHYVYRHDLRDRPVIVHDGFVGVELGINFVVEFTTTDGDITKYRYTGRCDGLHEHNAEPFIEENKTSTNVGGQWNAQWHVSHQPTGYMIGAALVLNTPIKRGAVVGLQPRLPKNELNGYVYETIERFDRQYQEWVNWLWEAIEVRERFKDDPGSATQLTHSCYRYFRPCMFWMHCAAPDEEYTMGLNELVDAPWDPLLED